MKLNLDVNYTAPFSSRNCLDLYKIENEGDKDRGKWDACGLYFVFNAQRQFKWGK